MIYTYALTKENMWVDNLELEKLKSENIHFYWVDFEKPTEEEINLLSDFFHFHHLAIEDCKRFIQRPNMSSYDDVLFFVLHSLNKNSNKCEEVDAFLGSNFIVTFHNEINTTMNSVKKYIFELKQPKKIEPLFVLHRIIDELVDLYFPIMHRIEDKINSFEENEEKSKTIITEIYEMRKDLIRLRKTIFPMRDLLYRIINSNKIQESGNFQHYFADIYDHLMKLSDMLVTNQDLTSDMRENFMSIESNKMNLIMKALTIVTTIFLPLQLITGIYGMNFSNMPELHWKDGYYIALSFMVILSILMTGWFIKKGWLLSKK